MKFILIYLLIGIIVAWVLEASWDELEVDFDPTMSVRLSMILLWPILVLAAVLGVLVGCLRGGNDDNSIGPGYGT